MKPANLAPAYCSLYPMLCEVARENGYSLAIHGTLGRDMDLLAVAWTEGAAEPLALVTAIAEILDGQMGLCARSNGDGTFTETSSWEPSKKPHGRLAWSIKLRDFAWNGTNPFIDLSVIPPSTTTPAPDAAITEEWLREIGFRSNDTGDGADYLWINSSICGENPDCDCDVQWFRPTGMIRLASERGAIKLLSITTQQQLLSLLADLGIEVEE